MTITETLKGLHIEISIVRSDGEDLTPQDEEVCDLLVKTIHSSVISVTDFILAPSKGVTPS